MPQAFVLQKWAFPYRIPDFIGKLESFDRHLSQVFAMANVSLDLSAVPPMNEGPPPPYKYADIVNREIYVLAKEIYEHDLQLFGYGLRD